jgi:uncharacterized protein involved in response to NO
MATAHAIWGGAFRSFFLAAAIYAALAVPWWLLVWIGAAPMPSWLVPAWWHGHEMIFGFVAAAIAGFLLTASSVWSGRAALRGAPLVALLALWILGRMALLGAGSLPIAFVAAVDVAFLPAVAGAVVWTLRGSGQSRNYAIAGLVLALALANAAMHAETLSLVAGAAGRALRFAVDGVVVLILVIGGRITPAFTRNAFLRHGVEATVRTWPWVDRAAIGAAGALACATAVTGRGFGTGILAAMAGVTAAVRLAGWQTWRTRFDPLLWSLHAASAWLVIGFLLVAAADLGSGIPVSAGLHAITAGAMGSGILAVMTRVGLGHTGRPLVLPGGVVWCHGLVHVAAVSRIAASMVDGRSRELLIAGGLAWAAAFGLFAICYWPILTRPRPDGKPG